MKSPVCPLCENREHEFCFSDSGYDLLACTQCGLFFIDPYPKAGAVRERVSRWKPAQSSHVTPERHYRASLDGYSRHFPFIQGECQGAKSVLDVGCGTGRLLELLGQESAIHRVGIELNADRAAFARSLLDCEVFQVPVEEFQYPSRFDVITMVNVLSHVPRFDRLFSSIRSLLTDNGKLIIRTGELEPGIKRRACSNWGIPGHMHVLGVNTAEFIADKFGFDVVRHARQPLSVNRFSRGKWKAPGRTPLEGLLKQAVVMTPFALPLLRRTYDALYGKRIHSSFLVMSPSRSETSMPSPRRPTEADSKIASLASERS